MLRPPPISTLFPYTTLFRSAIAYPTTKIRVNATCRKCPHKVHRMEMKTAISCTILRHTKILIDHFYRSAHKFEQICRHRLRRQNVGYSNFSQPQSHLSFCVLLQYLVERRRVVTQLGKLD